MVKMVVNEIVLGDCVEVMRGFDSDSVDCVVTDPPYGMSFMGKEWDKALPPKQAFVEMCRVLKPGALAFVMSSPRQDLMWRMAQLLEESGFELGQSFISWVYASGFPKAYDVSKGIDHKKGVYIEGELTKNSRFNIVGDEKNYNHAKITRENNPQSVEAKQWDGWKSVTGLKPALEVIFMVQKPMSEKTIVDNVLKWGTGAMNVDGCRIPIGDEPVDLECNRTSPKSDGSKMGLFKENGKMATATSQGRFPANLLVSDDALNDGKNHETHPGIYKNSKATSIFGVGEGKNNIGREVSEGNMGSFSRYFDLGAWAKHHGFLNVPKASTGERDYGLNLPSTRCGMMEDDNYPIKTGSGNLRNTKRKNIHPTVKPVELMGYLIELGCPPKGIVLDPFLGSGTTCVAAKKLNRQYIGIEIDAGYHKLAKSRVAAEPVNLDSLIKKGGV